MSGGGHARSLTAKSRNRTGVLVLAVIWRWWDFVEQPSALRRCLGSSFSFWSLVQIANQRTRNWRHGIETMQRECLGQQTGNAIEDNLQVLANKCPNSLLLLLNFLLKAASPSINSPPNQPQAPHVPRSC